MEPAVTMQLVSKKLLAGLFKLNLTFWMEKIKFTRKLRFLSLKSPFSGLFKIMRSTEGRGGGGDKPILFSTV